MSDYPPEHPTYPPAYPPSAYPPAPIPAPHFGAQPSGAPFLADEPVQTPGPGPFEPARPSQTEPARSTLLKVAAVAAVVGGIVGAGTVALTDDDGGRPSYAGLQGTTQAAPALKVDGSISGAAAKIRPSVVTIDVTTAQQEGTGSGVIIRPDGYILTNNHVVAGASRSDKITVTLADGRRVAATIVGRDPADDLAVIRVAVTGLTAATFASSAKLEVGQTVVAVGAPLGLSDTVTAGIVSSTARPVQTGDGGSEPAVFNAVQTDAAINPGNSGGPLVDLSGNVVGINSAIATEASDSGLQLPGQQGGNIGIGFAIPSDEAKRIASELITTGKATHAVMGVTVRDASRNQSSTSEVGAVVQSVTDGGPADKAGFEVGDVITKVGAQRIDTADALVAAIRSHAPTQTVSITFQRGDETKSADVTLGAASD